MTSIPAYAQPAFVEYVSAHAKNGDEEAKRLLGRLPKKNGIPKPKAPGPDPEKRRAEHRVMTHSLRVLAWIRCGGEIAKDEEIGKTLFVGHGSCEACNAVLGAKWELHHVQGAGHRRSRQGAGNVLAICWECHRRAHRGDPGTLAQIAQAPSLDAEARREALHRIDKIMEARRTPSVPVRIEEADPRSPSDAARREEE